LIVNALTDEHNVLILNTFYL